MFNLAILLQTAKSSKRAVMQYYNTDRFNCVYILHLVIFFIVSVEHHFHVMLCFMHC